MYETVQYINNRMYLYSHLLLYKNNHNTITKKTILVMKPKKQISKKVTGRLFRNSRRDKT